MTVRRRSLRLELVVTLAVILMMAVVSLSLVGEVVGGRRHYAQAEAQLREHARGLSMLVTPLVGNAPAAAQSGEIEQALRPSIGSQGIEAIEIHRFVGDTPQPVVALGLTPQVPAPRPIEDPEGQGTVTDDGIVVVDRPLRTFGASPRPPLLLRVVARPSPWTRLGDWREIVLMAVGVGAVLLVLGALLLELQVLRPLARVRNAVGEVERGNLGSRIPAEGPRELQDLAEAFNRMAGSLQARVQEIEAQRVRLVRSEQLASVGRIAAGVAHEVGNPLAAIVGYVELLLDPRTEPRLSDEQRTLLERSRTQIQRIQDIVGQLVDYARPSKKSMRPVELVGAAQALLSLLKHDPRCAGVELQVEGGPDIFARTDPALLDQVLQNLIVNGARAGREHPEAPCVLIRIGSEGDEATIEVQDSGTGVPDEVRPRLFEPFFTTARAGEGTGLGLAISQGLVEQMDGTLECLPTDARPPLRAAVSPGAVFRVTLPLAHEVHGADVSNATEAATV